MEPGSPKQRQYEAFRAFFVEERPSSEVARAFGYTPASFQVMCDHFRRDPQPEFFVSPKPGPRTQPKKSAARNAIVELRKRNHSVYEISEALKARDLGLSPTTVREVLKAEGFAPLPRRLDDERPDRPQPTVEGVADVSQLQLTPRQFETVCGGLFLFVPGLVALNLEALAKRAGLPRSRMIPAAHALSSAVAIKVDFDMALLVIASGLYRLLARKMRGYSDAHADRIFRDLVDMPATVTVNAKDVTVRFHRRAHLPIIIDSGMLNAQPVKVPWWNGASLRLTT